MFKRIENGWQLAKQCWRVLMLDKELLVFPLLSGVALIAVLASFALPLMETGYLAEMVEQETLPQEPLAYVILFLYYFVSYFVIVYFNTALVACAIHRFRGGDPTIATGLNAATARLPQIFAWAFVSATVGFILKLIEQRSRKVGAIVAGLLGMAWGIGTYLVVPVLTVERLGPFDAIRRSISLLRNSWGEALAANFGIGFVVFLASLAAMVPAVLGITLGASAGSGGSLIALGGVIMTVVLITLVTLISSALKAILIGALYEYASDGQVPPLFDEGLISRAFG